MSFIYGYSKNKVDSQVEAVAEESKTNKEDIAQNTTQVEKLKLKYSNLKNKQYTSDAKITNNKAEIDTLGAGLSVLSKKVESLKASAQIAAATAAAAAGHSATATTKVTTLENKLGPGEIIKATGDFYVGNSQGTFKIENLNIPPNHSLISVKFKAKPGLSGLYEATMYSGVDVGDVNYYYPVTDGVGLNAIKAGKVIGLKRNRTHDVWNTNYFVRTFGDAKGGTLEKNIDVEILYFKIP